MTHVANDLELPSRYRLIFSKLSIDLGIEKLAREIESWSKSVEEQCGQQPIALCILRGGVFFYADLIRAMECSVEMAFCSSWTYSSDVNVQFVDQEVVRGHRFSLERCDVAGRVVLLVDDICDTGGTLSFISGELVARGAKEVKSAVLIHRKIPDSKFEPNWKVFDYTGAEWFVGYGMEDRNHFANLPQVYAIEG